jgi:superfamily II DNA/RNA helicase
VKTERAQPSQPKHDILICPPNRLVYMINHEPPLVNLARVEWLIVDEADKLFEVHADLASFKIKRNCDFNVVLTFFLKFKQIVSFSLQSFDASFPGKLLVLERISQYFLIFVFY